MLKLIGHRRFLCCCLILAWVCQSGAAFGQQPYDSREEALSRSIGSYPDALTEAMVMADPIQRSRSINVIYRLWARVEPAAAWESLATQALPAGFPTDIMQRVVITDWLKQNPDAALQAAWSTGDMETIDLAYRDFAYQDPVAALAAAHSASLEEETWYGVFENVASRNAWLAAREIEELGAEGRVYVGAFIYQLAIQDVYAAICWLAEYHPRETSHLEALAARLLVSDPSGAEDFINRIEDQRFRRRLQSDFDRAVRVSKGRIPR